MSLIVGIDLGCLGATVSTIKRGSVDVILNEASKRTSPCLISFKDGQRYLGEPASSLESSNAKNTVRELKRFIGKSWSDPEVQRDIARLANKERFKQLPNDVIGVEVTHDGETMIFDIKSLLAMQLGGLKRTSEKSLKENQDTSAIIRDVVLSVPPYFNDAQRRAVMDAGKIANLNVLRLINDNAAVALDYGMWRNARGEFTDKPFNVLFVDVGYSDSWASVATYTKGKVSILSCAWDRELGGRDIDVALMNQFADEFQAKTKLNPRTEVKAMLKLRAAAEKSKQVLTPEGMGKAEVFVEYLMNETDFKSNLTIEQLDAAVAPLAARLSPMIQRALADANMKPGDINALEVVGGTTRMRQIKKAIAGTLGYENTKPPNFGVLTTLNTDESVSRGCTLMCALLSPNFRIATTLEVKELVPLPIKLQWEQPASQESGNGEDKGEDAPVSGNTLGLLKRSDETPKTRRVTFRRSEPFEIVASYDEPLDDFLYPSKASRMIGTFKVSGMPPEVKKGKIAVQFVHDKSGIFSCSSAQLQIEEESGEKDKKKIVKTDLKVESATSSCTDDEIQAKIKIESDLAAKDKALKDKADKRNELEEFTYSARSDIEGKLKQYATEDEFNKFIAKLDEEQVWLDENADDATFQQLVSRLSALHTPYDAIQNRLLEIEARSLSSDKLSSQVQSYLSIVNSVSPDYAHITEDERKKVRKACDDLLNWLTAQQEAQGKVPLNKDPILTASIIDEKVHKLRQECRSIVEKPKPKPAKPATPSPSATPPAGENDAQNENKMDVEGEDKPKDEAAKMDVEGEEKTKNEPDLD